MIELAMKYESSGISVLPIRPDKSKAPAVSSWGYLQQRHATPDEIRDLFRGECGIAAIGGKVSGNLEIIDFDDAGHFTAWEELVREHFGNPLFEKLLIVRTPRPGFHVYIRCQQIAGNQKLAMKLVADPEHPERKTVKTMIETRGEGGYVLLPGSPPACHETGRTYDLMQGSFGAIPEITVHEREVLMSCARSFNEIVREEHQTPASTATRSDSPGNDFAAQVTWLDVLRPHGYKVHSRRGEATLWTRPGKEHGISATTNYAGSDLFYPFSTNCYPFESDRGYGKFSVYALLNHSGDFHAAAKALAADGYGTPSTQRQTAHPPAQRAVPKAEPQPSDIVEPMSLKDEMRELYKTGLKPGESPGWESLRKLWTLRKGDWTLVTGIPSHGKSGFMNAVMVNLSRSHGWKWGVFSAENTPYTLHVADLMEQITGKPFNDGFYKRLSSEEHASALEFIQKHFRFIAPPQEEQTPDRVFACIEALKAFGIDGAVVDPWNELHHTWAEQRLPETEYVSRQLKRIRNLSTAMNIHVVLVAHPMKLQKTKEGKYPIPTPYDVSGSAHWRNKADCAICVWRDEAQPGSTKIYVQKIRRRFVGRIGEVELKFDLATGRYSEFESQTNTQRAFTREPGEDDE